MLARVKAIIGGRTTRGSAARSIVWNYAGFAYQLGVNFGLTAYVARHIAVVEYGLLLFVMSLSTALYLLDIGISYVLIQAYVAALENPEKGRLNDLISTAFLAMTALGTTGVLIFAALAAMLPGPFQIPPAYIHEAAAIFVIAGFVMQVELPGTALTFAYQASNRFDRINQIQLVGATIQLALSIAVLAAGFGIVALAFVQLAVSFVRVALYAIGIPASVPQAGLSLSRFRWSLLRQLIGQGKWAFLHNLNIYLFDFFTWTILASLGSLRDVAMYGVAIKAPKQLLNMVDKGANVLLPLFSKSVAQTDSSGLRKTYLKAQKLILGAVLPFILLGGFFARPLLELWVGNQYAGTATVMQWLLVSALAQALIYASDELVYACGQARTSAAITISGSLVSIAGALLLIPRYGASGLAAAIAVPQLFAICGWFAWVACKLSHTSLRALLRTALDGLAWPLAALAAEIAVICCVWRFLSPLWLVIAAIASGCVYLALWGLFTALPLHRNETEIAA